MSTFQEWTKHPKTGEIEQAVWIDDYFGNHNYGVKFADGNIYDPREVKIEMKSKPMETNKEQWKEEWANSEVAKRIESVELFAINHGFPQWNKPTVTDFIEKQVNLAVEEERERIRNKINELGAPPFIIYRTLTKDFDLINKDDILKLLE